MKKSKESKGQVEMTWKESLSEFCVEILGLANEFGGFTDWHCHLDREGTLKRCNDRRISAGELATQALKLKQDAVGELHRLGYSQKDLEERIRSGLLRRMAMGATSVCSFIDATADIKMTALAAALNVKKELQDKIKLIIGVHPIFGFKESDRWSFFQEAAEQADIIGGLPEKDDRKDSIGYDAHLKRVLKLGIQLSKEVHIHVDQGNDPREKGTETLIQAVRFIGSPEVKGSGDQPTVWAVHSISPSCYEERKFKQMLEDMKKYNIGLICCPRAALSMRQLRPLNAPVHNSIARILEMIKYKIPIRIGTDNSGDIFVPTGSMSMVAELEILADMLRFYDTMVLAKLGCGVPMNNTDREMVKRTLYLNHKAYKEIEPEFSEI